jgi:hypothetical protein
MFGWLGRKAEKRNKQQQNAQNKSLVGVPTAATNSRLRNTDLHSILITMR